MYSITRDELSLCTELKQHHLEEKPMSCLNGRNFNYSVSQRCLDRSILPRYCASGFRSVIISEIISILGITADGCVDNECKVNVRAFCLACRPDFSRGLDCRPVGSEG